MRQYNEISALWRAPLFQKSFFQDVARNWRGIGARYLLLLSMLTWLVVLIQATLGVSSFLKNEAPAAIKDFPTIHIVKGVASSDVPQPYIMKGDRGEPLFVLDTTGQTKLPSDVGAKLLLTSTELIQEDPPGMVQRRPLSAFPDTTVDQQWILSWIRLVRNAMIPGGLAACGGFGMGYHLLLALLFAAIGLAFNNMFKGGLNYAALLRLSIVSMTAPMLLDTLLWLFHVPSFYGVYWMSLNVLTLVYLYVGVKAAAEVMPKTEAAYTYRGPNVKLPPPPLPPEKPGEDLFP